MTLPRKELFHLPKDIIYLDGNSLGPMPNSVQTRMAHTLQNEWGQDLIRAWNTRGWMAQPGHIGDRIARLIGAQTGTVMVGDTLSIKVFQALSTALDWAPERRVILSDTGNFPSDLYMAEGLISLKRGGFELKLVAPSEIVGAIDDKVAAVMLTHVDYRSGARFDMARITQAAQASGATMIWDLAHSVGAVDVDLEGCGCALAVGCTYKYLNAGPGAPAFIYVRPDLIEAVQPALSGWLGHAAPFAFDAHYRPARGMERLRVGTPPVLQMAALDAALDLWEDIDLAELWTASRTLSDRFISGIEASCPQLRLISPRDPHARGSHVSFAFEHAYATIQALSAKGVIGDFRAPDILRFGITPLYLDASDIDRAVEITKDVLENKLWDTPEYLIKNPVT